MGQPDTSRSLLAALDQNDAVKEEVKQSADELLVVNAVLKSQLPDHTQQGDVAIALKRTDAIEERIQESVEGLAAVNQLLENEIEERINLERELLATKSALAKSQVAPAQA
ncbi:MAG: hypothetical protein H7Z77_09615 [Chitinophagaceae bacterium]|nr:hypothetical protein [Polaromonas sp.]